MRNRILPICICALTVSACNTEKPSITEQNTSSVTYSSQEIQETRNVSYRGTLEPIGPSIYQQGTHMLSLGDGRMILLESTLVDFEPFIGTSVEVFGALRPTAEAGGIIMRVEQITGLSPISASSANPVSVSSEPSSRENSSSLATAIPASTSPISASAQLSPKPSSTSSMRPPESDVHVSLRVSKMVKEDISDARWTQLYCSPHIGFCVPVHKNWWYISFGNKADTLWHVEVSSEEFEALGSGIIAIDLIGGDIASTNHTDGEVRISGSTVTGYRSWTQGRHFAITADAKLESAVRYMTTHVRVMEQ